MTAPDAQPAPRGLGPRELAGYRVLRSLARDERAEMLLGHRNTNSSSPTEVAGATDTETVALKVSPASRGGWEVALRECTALECARGEHVVELLDMDSDDTSIRLIFERLPRGDLAELLRVRDRIDAGEAVTLLAPIAVTLLRLHATGVAHGNLSPRTVLFRDDGSPTLIGFSRAEFFEPGAPEVVLEGVEAVLRDRTAARSLATAVLGRVTGGRARAARELHDDLSGCDDELVLPLLAARLFEVATALPVRFTADEPGVDAATSDPRAVPVSAAVEFGATASDRTPSRIVAGLGRIVPESLVLRVLNTAERSPVMAVVRVASSAVMRRWHSWTPGRRRVVLAVAAAALTVAVVMAVVPAGGATTDQIAPRPTATAESLLADQRSSDPAVTGNDPRAAASALLQARERCLSSLSVLCLDHVDEAGSGALDDDQKSIHSAQQGGELPDPLASSTGGGAPVLVERLGDSALVRLGELHSGTESDPTPSPTSSTRIPSRPASLLLVKGEAGWRIRDLIAAGEAVG
ncbi:MAG: protein kinase [Pseudolysinimonas sp.]